MKYPLGGCPLDIQSEISRVLSLPEEKIPKFMTLERCSNSEDNYEKYKEKLGIIIDFYKDFSECVLLDFSEENIFHTEMYYEGVLGGYPVWDNQKKYESNNFEDWIKYREKIIEELKRIR